MAKVVPLASAKAFLDALEKSGLLSASDIDALRSARGDDSDPKLVARDLVRENKLTKWQAGQLLHGFHQLMVGKYKLMDQLGSGEMGRVYLGEHAQLARKVSLKILSRKYTANPEILKKVLEDGRRASGLDHCNLSHVFDVNSADERYYLVTEFVEGKNLRQLVEASGAVSPAQAIDIVRQAAAGLEHAHGQNVIHGDLKPSNLIVDASGIVKILDLGLARLTETSPAVGEGESTEVATLAAQSFHAPEQSGRHEVSPLVDIFALGGILFYLLSGKPPLGNVKSAQDVQGVCPAASAELAELCARMLAADPAARPQSARQVIEGLDAVARAKSQPAATEEKKSSSGEKSPGKQKLPLVARSLETPYSRQESVAVIAIAEDEVDKINLDVSSPGQSSQSAAKSEPAADDAFAGFSLQTKRKKQRASPEPAAVPANEGATAAPPAAPAKPRVKPSMAIVIVAGIGGGVLILALGVTALFWALSKGGNSAAKIAVAKLENKQAAAAPLATEANPETNPEENPAEPPQVESPGSATKSSEKTVPESTGEVSKTNVSPVPSPGAKGAATVSVETVKPPLPPGAVPMPLPPGTTVPAPQPEPVKPEPAKPEPVKPEPVKPVPAPAPEIPAGNPFEGMAKLVTLPPLEAKGKPLADATMPFLLGSLKLPPKLLCLINLKGGDNAISTNAKQKFVLEAGNKGTSERDWDIKLVTEGTSAPVVVARLAIQDDQLNFQWTDEAKKQLPSAPYLCNCVLTMNAGSGHHQMALRQPQSGEPMKVDLDKTMSAKYTIEYPPNPKQIVIQLGPPEGKIPKFKFEKPELTAKKDTTVFMLGPADDVMLLHFRLDCAMPARLLTIGAKPGYQIHGMTQPKPWVKTVLTQIGPATEQANALATQKLANLPKSNLTADQKITAQNQFNKEVEDTAKQKSQAVMLTDLAKELQASGKLHFQILYEADTETRIVLLSTGGEPPITPTTP
jgi:serine/threonine protein kinase